MKSKSPRNFLLGLLAMVLALAFVPVQTLADAGDIWPGPAYVTSTAESYPLRVDSTGNVRLQRLKLAPYAFTVNATMTVDSGNQVRIGSVAGNVTLTVPSAVTAGSGYVIDIQDIGGVLDATHTVNVTATSGNINGSASAFSLATAYGGARLISDGTNWFKR